MRTWPSAPGNPRIRTSPCCPCRRSWPIPRVRPRLGFGSMTAQAAAVTRSHGPYGEVDEVVVVLVEQLEGFFELRDLLLGQPISLVHLFISDYSKTWQT